jgi:seryl-tRNA synthetase
MLDIQLVRTETDSVIEKLRAKKVAEETIRKIIELDQKRRNLQQLSDEMKKKRNESSRNIGKLIKNGEDVTALKEETRRLSEEIKSSDTDLKNFADEQKKILLSVPNIPHESVPQGQSEEDNVVVSDWGEKPSFDFEPKAHWEIGENLGVLELARATKIAGTGFPLLKAGLAKLERALISWMIDLHVKEHGFVELAPPYLVNRESITGTGQLPKLEDDMYHCDEDDLFLIPTAEVPVTNFYSNEILNAVQMPVYFVAYTPCFRREAGSYGKDTRGLTRVHQFSKVELVKMVFPEDSYKELEKLRQNAETILQKLGLHYRVLELCTADLSFAAAKCYDLEVWAPGMQRYLEVSSCSNFESFQARRMGIRFRREAGAKAELVHTLNGSGLALPRTMIAIMENFQTPDGNVEIPEVLKPYYGSGIMEKQ